MNEMPRVSVVIPAYNSARTITATVASALEQTMGDIEILVVDDGSSDTTVETVGAIADPRVRLIRQANGGAAAARNAGIRQARGEWVAFLDSDDIWLPHKLERQLELMTARPGTFASEASAYHVDDNLKPLALHRCVPTDDILLSFLRFQNLPGAMSSWIVKRTLLDDIGLYDTELVILEDWEFSLRLARHANPLLIEEPLSLYRVHPGNRSRDLDIHIRPGFIALARLFADPDLPESISRHRREIYARFYTMLCGGALRVGRWPACAYWGGRALWTDPRMLRYMLALPLRRLRRKLAVRASAPGP